jgi:membrane protein DedA with SNARE-associated domain
VFEWLASEVSNNPVTYLIVFVAAGTDVLVPLIPSETIVLAASVLAGQGELLIWLIVPAAALGAFLGDNVSYWLGRRVGDPIANRFFKGEKGRSRLEWAEGAIRTRGVFLIVIGRFVPGGRTATTFAAGTLEMDYRRFLIADASAALIWAVYISMLGYLGGETFEDNLLLPLAIAFAVATLVAAAAEGWRRWQRRRGKDLLGEELEPEGK